MVTVCLLMDELSAFNLSATSAGLSCGNCGHVGGWSYFSPSPAHESFWHDTILSWGCLQVWWNIVTLKGYLLRKVGLEGWIHRGMLGLGTWYKQS